MLDIKRHVKNLVSQETPIAPLVVFRIAFGFVMFVSTIRFFMKGWIADFYIQPIFHFTFYGFDWVKPLPAAGMYVVFILMAVAALFILLGLFYRISSILFFVLFLYVELLDKSFYLNHYYLVTLLSFLLIWVPANRYFSLDVVIHPSLSRNRVQSWTINIFKFQLLIVYFFAGISKINYEWLIEAMPMRIWLPASEHIPLIGPWLKQTWVAYLFSWTGIIYDLSIGFFLLYRPTRHFAYVAVIVFHLFTALLFKIGMFPYIMMAATLIFFFDDPKAVVSHEHTSPRWANALLIIYFTLQLLIPFRYLAYKGNLFWTEEGFRFSWRVMIMEKSGLAFFYVNDPTTGNRSEVMNSSYLSSLQERMMATQPDMVLQYAHFLDSEFRKRGVSDPVITVEDYVTLNGKGSRLLVDSTVDLSTQEEGFTQKTWILPFEN